MECNRTDFLFGPVITTGAHLAFSGARIHSNNTAEMSAAGICLGTSQARTHVQLALACQQLMLKVQHRSRCSMQHVYDHTGNLGNECAHHAIVLGALGHVPSHDFSTCWAHHSFVRCMLWFLQQHW